MRKALRYLPHAVLIAIIVSAAGVIFYRLPTQEPARRASWTDAPPVERPKEPWAPTGHLIEVANEGFHVVTPRTDNLPLAGSDFAPESEWPQFNGARRDNKSGESGLLATWPAGGPPLQWASHGMGEGYSTVAVVDGVAYTMGNKDKCEALIAVDVGTGEKLWCTPFGWASQLGVGNGPRSTPAVFEGAVYGIGGKGELVCLDAQDGKIRWQKNIVAEFEGRQMGWGICESVLIDQGRLICTPGGSKATVVALDPATGDVIWQTLTPTRDSAAYTSAAVAEVGGIRQYVHFTAQGTIGVRADDGEFLWRENSAANRNANCSSPQVAGDLVFSASSYGNGGALVKLTPSDSGIEAERVYKTNSMKNHHGDMVIVDGNLYGSNDPGILTCLELATGDVKWQTRDVGKGAVTYAEGRLYVRVENGKMFLVAANPERFQKLGEFDQESRSTANAWPHPVVAAGSLFLRDQDVLLCYDLRAEDEPTSTSANGASAEGLE